MALPCLQEDFWQVIVSTIHFIEEEMQDYGCHICPWAVILNFFIKKISIVLEFMIKFQVRADIDTGS